MRIGIVGTKTNCGVYKIINILNNKVYVGSSSNLKSRKYVHFRDLSNKNHCNTHLQNSYNKHGKDNFKWEVVEYVGFDEDKEILKKNLLEREQYYLDLYESYNSARGYNLCSTAGSKLGCKDSQETINKRIIANTGKKRTSAFRKRMSRLRKGKTRGNYPKKIFSEEHIKNLSESHKGYKPSEETIRKMSEVHKNRPPEVQKMMNEKHCKKVINLDTGIVFNSIKEAGEFYGVNRGHISSVCSGKRKIAGGYRWSYFKNKKQPKRTSVNNKVVKNIDTGLIFPSACEAGRFYKINNSHISAVCRGKRKTAGGYRWYYL